MTAAGPAPIHLDPASAALVIVDLQNIIIDLPLEPNSGREILAACKKLADKFRAAGSLVVIVKASLMHDPEAEGHGRKAGGAPPVDQPMAFPDRPMPDNWADLADGLYQPGDLLIEKRQWGAFFGTGLDEALKQRGIRHIVIAGIATNFGVEATVREGYACGYGIIAAEDAMGSFTSEMHHFALRNILPRIARIRPLSMIYLG